MVFFFTSTKMKMSRNTSIIQFGQFLHELWAFESGYLLKNHIQVLKVQMVGALLKLADALSKLLVAVFMKVRGYTTCQLLRD